MDEVIAGEKTALSDVPPSPQLSNNRRAILWESPDPVQLVIVLDSLTGASRWVRVHTHVGKETLLCMVISFQVQPDLMFDSPIPKHVMNHLTFINTFAVQLLKVQIFDN